MRQFATAAPGARGTPGRARLVGLGLLVLAGVLRMAGDSWGAQVVGGVRISDREIEGGLQLNVENANLAAVTLTVTVLPENAVVDRKSPMVVTVPGRGSFPFAVVRPTLEQGAYSYRVRYDWQFGQAGVTPDRSAVYELPFAKGSRFKVSQAFHGSFTHSGNNAYAVDFDMPEGTPVHAARAGTVEIVIDQFDRGGQDPSLRDRANLILVRHSDGTYGEYVHLRRNGIRVKPGQKVKAREILGDSGNTGYSQGPHLHFAVFRAVDGRERETFPIRFRAKEGRRVEPKEDQVYTAP